ncbi:DEP domain-containing protein 1B [Hyla sarda]|uniref:DEP domain-containing protein 1B n=1 Tax=Hyla sarda TaxID=327740 RepID=UPI0024C4322D|nr:DEP domain-containing protein 1B [Hyla sarda]
MEHRIIGPGPYRATKLWNETIELFRSGMTQKKHRVHFKTYDRCFTASEAVDWLHELLQCNQNFGPEVTRSQTIQLLKKFLKNHVIEDVKGRWGKEDFEDNSSLYRFPPTSPLKPYPKRPPHKVDPLPFPRWTDEVSLTSRTDVPVKPVVMNSEMWYKRHSIAIGEVPACRLVYRRELTAANIEDIWKSRTLLRLQKIFGLDSLDDVMDAKQTNGKHIMHNVYNVNKQGIVVMDDRSKELPHWLLSAMKCLANWPNCSEVKQSMYLGFERDVFKTISDYFSSLQDPLLTFPLFDVFVNILGLLQKRLVAIEALQVCCLLLPPENRRKLQLLMRMMARISLNREMPPLCDATGNRALMVQTFSRCVLRSKEEVDLGELLSTNLVTFMMDNCQDILTVPTSYKNSVEDYVAHQRRVQIKYPGANIDSTLHPAFIQPQGTTQGYEYQKLSKPQDPVKVVLEEIINNKTLSSKEKKKKLKQFQRAHPQVYKERLPTPESEAAVFPEKTSLKSQLSFFTLKRPFQSFQRTRSFRMIGHKYLITEDPSSQIPGNLQNKAPAP